MVWHLEKDDVGTVERPETCPLVVGMVLNYRFNKRNFEEPLKKTIISLILLLPSIHLETNCPKSNNSGNYCFGKKKKKRMLNFPVSLSVFFFFFP